MEKDGFKQFVQEIQNKITIAVAVVVIRTKPLNKTAKNHAMDIQAELLEGWNNEGHQSDFETKILSLRRIKILEKIERVLPCFPLKLLSDTCEDEAGLSNIVATQDSVSDFELDNAEFLRAMVCLKFAVESKRTLPLSNIQTLASNLRQQTQASQYKGRSLNGKEVVHYSQDDSGIDTLSRNIGMSNISSHLFRNITHSSDAEAMLTKSALSVLKYIHNHIMYKPEESFNNWRGSVLEHMCSILQEAAKDCVCSEPIKSFIRGILESIWISEDTNKHVIWEYQCSMLIEFCCTTEICTEILNFLFEKLHELVKHIEGVNVNNFSDFPIIEKCPHFLGITSHLLSKWKHFRNVPKKIDSPRNSFKNITDLWKSKFQAETLHEVVNDGSQNNTHLWKECLEKLITVSSKDFSLISFQVWDLMKILNSLDSNSPPDL